ncbi:shikimate dehydrogenase [Amnibacterium endophyticum]|uniref:Shikimate dehydrogenase n=1 Tax=Amnibacterium endophyticum TaxID=2109337 RepID=A0ABW4LCC3_9MICO
MTGRLAVLGSPIAHSRSPLLHDAAARVLGLDRRYERIEVREDGLRAFLGGLGADWVGLSLTMPLKRAVLPLVGGHDPLVARLGLANTVVLGERPGLFNTDVGGVEAVLADLVGARRAVVLGAGATAASALEALARLGVEHRTVAARRPAAAAGLGDLATEVVELSAAPLADADVVVSTLPGGADAVLDVPARVPGTPLLDVAYDPWPSALGAAWAAAGGTLRHGLEMLVEQAVLQVRLFTGGTLAEPIDREPEVRAVMRDAVGLG